MKRTRIKTSLPRLSRDAERLVTLASGLGASGSRLEDQFWDARLGDALARLLDHGGDASIEAALDHLYATRPAAYDVLIDAAEAHAESLVLEDHDVLLIAAPVLAWSKYSIYSGPLRADSLDALRAHLYGHIAAAGTKVALVPYLYSIDQLPRQFSETRELARHLGRVALGLDDALPKQRHMPETAPLLADTRYVVAAIAAPHGQPLFSWQEGTEARPTQAVNREQVLERWRSQAGPLLASILTGSATDVMLPDSYHVSCRESDRAVRPYGIRAALAFLEAALHVEAAQLRAVVALFGKERGEEYRIGLTLAHAQDVLHGVVWPLYGREDGGEPDGPLEEIETLLRECKVGQTNVLEELFPLEFCEDCGAPMFADPAGELVHAELPEDAEQPRAHLH